MNDSDIIEIWAQIGNGIVAKVKACDKRDDVLAAAHTLMRRLVQSGSTLRELYDNAKRHDWTADGAAILRTSYDATLQALYILCDPKERQQRARRFLDFAIVEQVKLIRVCDKKLTRASQQIAASGKRPAVEPAIQAEYQRVCKKYGYDMGKPPVNWYKGSLRDLAVKTDYETEYEILHKQLSGIVHSSMFGISGSSCFTDYNLIQCLR